MWCRCTPVVCGHVVALIFHQIRTGQDADVIVCNMHHGSAQSAWHRPFDSGLTAYRKPCMAASGWGFQLGDRQVLAGKRLMRHSKPVIAS